MRKTPKEVADHLRWIADVLDTGLPHDIPTEDIVETMRHGADLIYRLAASVDYEIKRQG